MDLSKISSQAKQYQHEKTPQVLTNEEIVKQGKEAQKYDFLYRKQTARNYQVRWIRDDIFRKHNTDKVHVIFAPTGAGKTTTKKMVISSIDRLTDKNKSFNIITVPDDSQIIITEFYNELIDALPKNVGIVISNSFTNRVTVRANVHVYRNDHDFKVWSSTMKHIVSIGAHNFFRNHLKQALINHPSILNGRVKLAMIDEIHKALHTDGKQFYPENLENNIEQYSEIGIGLIKDLLALDFTVTGFSGTPSKQQRGESTENGVFHFVDMDKEDLKEVQLNNTYLDKTRFISTSSNFNKSHSELMVEAIKEDVYNRNGIGMFYLARGGTQFSDEYDYDTFLEMIYPSLPTDSVLIWFGGTNKYRLPSGDMYKHSDIKIGRWRTNYETDSDIHEVLSKNPQIKLVVVKNLLKDGFNYHDANTIIFGKPINKENEFLTNEQQIGRGVRPGSDGLRIIFSSETKDIRSYTWGGDYMGTYTHSSNFNNAQRLLSTVLDRGTILEKDKYVDLQNTFQTQKDSMVTMYESLDIEKRIRVKLPLLKSDIEQIILAKSATLFGQKLETKDISDEITKATERFFGSFDNMTKTAGMNDEDGFIYFPTTKKFISYDIKSKVLSTDESDMFDAYSNEYLTLKDRLKGDGKINNHILHIIVTSTISNNKLDSLNFDIVEISKDYSDNMQSNTIKIPTLISDLSIHSFTV